MEEFFALGLFAFVMVMLIMGFPVAFSLAGASILWAFLAFVFDFMTFDVFGAIPGRLFGGVMNNSLLMAVPLFVFMGTVLERSKIAEELLESMAKVFSRVPGGLGISVTLVGMLLAASTGVVGATVVTMGLMSLPTMLKRGYNPSLATGSICAAGTLGQIIPPSIVLILLGDQISNSYVEAQRLIGNWSPEPVSVGDLFAGALLPGLVLVGLYISYQLVYGLLRPQDCPAVEPDGDVSWVNLLETLVAPLVLIVAVLGSILGGLATPTESAAVGAAGALWLALYRLSDSSTMKKMGVAGIGSVVAIIMLTSFADLRFGLDTRTTGDYFAIGLAIVLMAIVAYTLWHTLVFCHRTKVLNAVMEESTFTSAKIFAILIGATFFSLVFRELGGDEMVGEFLTSLEGGITAQLILVMVVIFILGMFLDFIEIILIVVPIVAPILLQSDISPVWLAVMIAVNLQTSFLTPPFGFTLFYLRGVAPQSVRTIDMYKGVVPFIGLQIVMLGILMLYPELANWLPEVIFGTTFGE